MRVRPRISLSKLAEYTTATPRRQRQILMNALMPRDYIVTHHTRARSSILWAYRRGLLDEDSLDRSVLKLRGLQPKNERDAHEIANSIAAVDAFRQIAPQINLGRKVQRPRSRSAIMLIEGVAVSVDPSLLIRGGTAQQPTVGGLGLYLVKNNPLKRRAAEYGTTILRTFLTSRLEGSAFQVDPELCQIADVFAHQVYTAPKAYKRRMDDVAATCDSIRRIWLSLVHDYQEARQSDGPSIRH